MDSWYLMREAVNQSTGIMIRRKLPSILSVILNVWSKDHYKKSLKEAQDNIAFSRTHYCVDPLQNRNILQAIQETHQKEAYPEHTISS